MADDPNNQQPPDQTVDAPNPRTDHPSGLRAIQGGKSQIERQQERQRLAERRQKAFDLWCAEVPFEAIGKALGVSGKTAFYDVQKERRARLEVEKATTDQRREKQYWQYARLIRGLWSRAIAGNEKASEIIGKHMKAQAQLYGLDMPIKVAATTPDGQQWAPLQATLATLSVEELRVLEKLADARLLGDGAIDVEVVAKK